MNEYVTVIGAGLAGCEAAWQAAQRGATVKLFEMKPMRYTPAHSYSGLSELVCSNSLRSGEITNAAGLLKKELSIAGSLIMEAAYATSVPAGGALAVDRYRFSDYITQKISAHPNITLVSECVERIPETGVIIVATGPLTDGELFDDIRRLTGRDGLYFHDAAAPIVSAESIDMSKAFFASRYGKGCGTDYLNCPMNREEYLAFYEALISAETAPLKEFEGRDEQGKIKVFEGCMPIEVMAKRGIDTMRFGPLKPVGIELPSGGEAYAIVQLRRENDAGTMYNLVGFQTNLKFGEQKRVFGMIPGLEQAEFYRYGVMHRNTYLDSPGFLTDIYSTLERETLFFAGQMTGVEGYIESAASGLVAGINAAAVALGREKTVFPPETMIGALARHVSVGEASGFQPMNANFGIIESLPREMKIKKKFRGEAYANRSIEILSDMFPSNTETL